MLKKVRAAFESDECGSDVGAITVRLNVFTLVSLVSRVSMVLGVVTVFALVSLVSEVSRVLGVVTVYALPGFLLPCFPLLRAMLSWTESLCLW